MTSGVQQGEVQHGEVRPSGIVGYTGFVGSNLAKQFTFDRLYNSKNADQVGEVPYSLFVMSAAKAEKWRINQDPDTDLAHIQELKDMVDRVDAEQFVLISTVDVYGSPIDVAEEDEIVTEGLHPYGLHRYQLEQHVRERHPGALILRLPGLFGPGLKKNVIYDFLNDNNIQAIHAEGTFQYYNLGWLRRDIERALGHGITLLNVTAEPISTHDLVAKCFGHEFRNAPEGAKAGLYDMRSSYASLWDGHDGYLYGRDQVLAELAVFVAGERASS